MSVDELIRERLRSQVEPVDDVEAVVEQVLARSHVSAPRRRTRPLLAAAVVLLVAAVAGTLVIAGRPFDEVVSGPETISTSPTTVPAVEAGPVSFRILRVRPGPAGTEPGSESVEFATTQAELDALWARTSGSGPSDEAPVLEFSEQVVVSMTISDGGCSTSLVTFDRVGSTIRPKFEGETPCEMWRPRTFLVAIEWDSVGPQFEVSVPSVVNGAPKDVPLARSPRRPAPAGDLRADLSLPSSSVLAGEVLEGEVVVQNDTGEPVDIEGCGSPYQVVLRNAEVQQTANWTNCLQTFTLPVGESRWPVSLSASYNSCTTDTGSTGRRCGPSGLPPALPIGTYDATVEHVDGAPQPPSEWVKVLPAD
jgi:hypothetical protein